MKMQYLQYGSPTAELFAASYNNRSNKSNTIELIAGEIGYYNNTKEGWLRPSANHGIYNRSDSSRCWIASPYYSIGNAEMYIDGYSGYLYAVRVTGYSREVSPIVCIPTSVFNSKYGTEANLLDE